MMMISIDFIKTQKFRYLKDEASFFLQLKKIIHYTSRITLWQKTVCRGGNLEEKFVRNLVPRAAFRFRRKVKRLFKKKKSGEDKVCLFEGVIKGRR